MEHLSPLPSFVTVLALILYFVITLNVGRARIKYQIKAPAMSGDPNFECVIRVQQNTLEQMMAFLPALWLFSLYVSPIWGAGLGLIWVIGRAIYAWGYYQAPEKRFPGFGMSMLSFLGLLIGSFVGIILHWIHSGNLI